jgi:hypothetical protein
VRAATTAVRATVSRITLLLLVLLLLMLMTPQTAVLCSVNSQARGKVAAAQRSLQQQEQGVAMLLMLLGWMCWIWVLVSCAHGMVARLRRPLPHWQQ